ncbi:undecaprenyldiphospho-muramoylpentapeptide beta-N-acetylglucosaminyltransferase [Alloscardovia omnicolens]|uniref:undecaprenyldiphospho-muramoylpentapeptide beta-N-acetylglucosaminyltransferase n=1 Tax=Alloscardovia omnicolens TaxID=419015 RepID=UPI003A5EAA37
MNQSDNLHIVLAGGGTAGHVNPLLSIAQCIRRLEPQAQISVIGTSAGLESRLVPQAGFELDTIEKVPFPRSLAPSNLMFPARFMKQLKTVKEIFQRRQADVVVGVGGYAAAPAYVQAHSMRIPLVIHEQNARAGMANKLGARWAQYVGVTYDDCGLTARAHTQVERVGLPLRTVISERAAALEKDRGEAKRAAALELGLDPDIPIVAITGGSLGAVNVNTAVANASHELLSGAQVVHLTGKGKSASVRAVVSALAGENVLSDLGSSDGDYHIAEYWENMDAVMAAADLVICRSGAGTVAELTALGIPAVYVPLPIGNGEQSFNAQPVVNAGGGIMVHDDEFTAAWIRQHVVPLLADKDKLSAMSAIAWNYGKRDAAEKMAHTIIDLAYAARTK